MTPAHKALKCAERYHAALTVAKRKLAAGAITRTEYLAIVRLERDKIIATML